VIFTTQEFVDLEIRMFVSLCLISCLSELESGIPVSEVSPSLFLNDVSFSSVLFFT